MAFVVAATWKAKEGEEARVEKTIRTLMPLTRGEEKNVLFQAHVSPEDPRVFFLYEQYVDADGYESHKATDHFKDNVINYILEHLEERSVQTYETIDV